MAGHVTPCAPRTDVPLIPAQGVDIVPIPGTKRRKYLEENVAAPNIELTPADLKEISAAAPPGAATGLRYPEPAMQAVNR